MSDNVLPFRRPQAGPGAGAAGADDLLSNDDVIAYLVEAMGGWTPPTSAQWAKLSETDLVRIRIAFLAVTKPKDASRVYVKALGPDGLRDLLAALAITRDFFSRLQVLLTVAHERFREAGESDGGDAG
ncbi:MAG: hypothetical protein ACR652_03320 [Methylocystis sp.]|uniref:hypothetical protein n=1 Tax=Methylocystis sp. TaxID=1911079 RepID=UPI003DA64E1C